MNRIGIGISLAVVFATASASAQPMEAGVVQNQSAVPGLDVLVRRIETHRPFARTETGVAYLEAAASLPNQLRRHLWVDRQFTTAYGEAEYAPLDERAKRPLRFRPVTELAYYTGTSDKPMMDVLAVDLAVRGTPMESPAGLAGKKILIFNPRVITQGRLLASLGAHVTIVHDQQRMAALYSEPGDVGVIPGHGGSPDGSLRLIRTVWPGEDAEGAAEIGTGYDLVIVSDWISNGLSTLTPVPPRWMNVSRSLRPLPSTPEAFVETIAGVLAPGGRFLNYAFGPIQTRTADMSLAYADVGFPAGAEAIRASGLEIVALDGDDTLQLQRLMRVREFNEPVVRPDGMPSMTSAYTLLIKPVVGGNTP